MAIRETPVEAFYGHGAERRAKEADGFLSFGYWNEDTPDYTAAAEALLDYFLTEMDIREAELMLNVCCGNGAETTRMFERVLPSKIHGLDITAAHIDACREKAAARGLSDRLTFEHGDACKTRFADETFSHVVGIEGPAHFVTRERFFAEAHRVLKPGGALMLTDSILRRDPEGAAEMAIAQLCLRVWHMPRENWVDIDVYRQQLERNGFRVEILRSIGHKVFPGFAAYNIRRDAIQDTIRVHGKATGMGLVFICWLLGYTHTRGLSDYLLVKAIKILAWVSHVLAKPALGDCFDERTRTIGDKPTASRDDDSQPLGRVGARLQSLGGVGVPTPTNTQRKIRRRRLALGSSSRRGNFDLNGLFASGCPTMGSRPT